ncbi:hypothetical protein ABZ916_39725 [Streptomyces sp. NPDC046853]|uniref:hypothetical protein n=1 Tax=Streptomyces sp. NPDC046853 TaxID=3154920 RepID=UPI0033CB405E
MTISLERPVRAQLPPTTPSVLVFGPENDKGGIPAEKVQAVVTLRVAMTRDMLGAALNLASCASYDEDPDSWSVERVREYVELEVNMQGPWRLLQDSHEYSELIHDPSVGDRIRAELRAIDRAYPEVSA